MSLGFATGACVRVSTPEKPVPNHLSGPLEAATIPPITPQVAPADRATIAAINMPSFITRLAAPALFLRDIVRHAHYNGRAVSRRQLAQEDSDAHRLHPTAGRREGSPARAQ